MSVLQAAFRVALGTMLQSLVQHQAVSVKVVVQAHLAALKWPILHQHVFHAQKGIIHRQEPHNARHAALDHLTMSKANRRVISAVLVHLLLQKEAKIVQVAFLVSSMHRLEWPIAPLAQATLFPTKLEA